jgi:hypothetical protein
MATISNVFKRNVITQKIMLENGGDLQVNQVWEDDLVPSLLTLQPST